MVSGVNETGKADRALDGLTPQERDFVKLYISNGHNATGTYRTMHPDAASSTAQVEGLKIRKRESVDAAIREIVGHSMKPYLVTNERIIQELACLAFLDPADYLKEDGSPKAIHDVPEEARRAIAGLDVAEIWEGTGAGRVFVGYVKKFGITNKAKALSELVRIRGMITEKHEVAASEDLAALLTKARKRRRTTKKTTEEVTDLEDLFE